jgi:mannose-1-phosphate guanylyltransferase
MGTRLWPLTDERSKPAFPYLGVPLVRHAARLAMRAGARQVWANTHHLPNTVRDGLGSFLPRVTLVHETEILGTGGALINMREALAGSTVVVINAKIATDIKLFPIVVAHEASGATVTMVCVANPKREKFTHVQTDAEGNLTGFVPLDKLEGVTDPLAFTGIQILSPKFFRDLPPLSVCDTIKDLYPRVQARGERIVVHKSTASWNEFSTLQRYRDLHVQAKGGYIDVGAVVHSTASVKSSVVWRGAHVAKGAKLEGCIVGEGVIVPEGYVAKDAVLMQASHVKETRTGRVVGNLLDAAIV